MIFIDANLTHVVLRDFQPLCRLHPVTIILREPPPTYNVSSYAGKLAQDKRESELVGEVAAMTLSCGAAIISWIVVLGSGAAIPISGGSSAAVTYLGYAAGIASTAQCFNGAGRTYLEISNPKEKDWLDSQEWYTNASLAVDVISVAGALASGAAVIKTVQLAKQASHKSTTEILKGLTRAERKRLTKEILKSNNPKIPAKVIKQLVSAGKYPKMLSQSQVSQALSLKIKEAVGACLSFSGSAMSGSLRTLAVGVYEQTTS